MTTRHEFTDLRELFMWLDANKEYIGWNTPVVAEGVLPLDVFVVDNGEKVTHLLFSTRDDTNEMDPNDYTPDEQAEIDRQLEMQRREEADEKPTKEQADEDYLLAYSERMGSSYIDYDGIRRTA